VGRNIASVVSIANGKDKNDKNPLKLLSHTFAKQGWIALYNDSGSF